MIGRFFVRQTRHAHVVKSFEPYLTRKNGIINATGFSESRLAHMAASLSENSRRQCLIITSNESQAKRLSEDIAFFTEKKIYYIPGQEPVFFRYDAKSHNLLEQRLNAIINILKGEAEVIVSSIDSVLKKMVPKEAFKKNILNLQIGDNIRQDILQEKLMLLGYERVHQVEAKGQYSIRGGIVDIFPVDASEPYRIEFFDTEVDSIRVFETSTQRSIKNVYALSAYPSQELIADEEIFKKAACKIEAYYDDQIGKLENNEKLKQKKDQLLEFVHTRTNLQILENHINYFYDKVEYLPDYMDKDTLIMIEDPDRISDKIKNTYNETREDFKYLLEKGEVIPYDFNLIPSYNDYRQIIQKRLVFFFTPFIKRNSSDMNFLGILNISTKSIPAFQGRMDMFKDELERYIRKKYQIFITCSTKERMSNIKEFIERNHQNCILYTSSLNSMGHGQIVVGEGSLSTGFEYQEEKIVMITDSDIFANAKIRRSKPVNKDAKPIKAFTDLKPGDYVVHENHGIGRYLGIEQLDIQKTKKDYFKIKYAGEDMLYVPVEQMNLVQKYIGADSGIPRINKLSSGEWKKTKAKAKGAIVDMAKELLQLSAIRNSSKGYSFSQDTTWQTEFEDAFPYEETGDQLKCAEEIKRDMQKDIPMDRLLCGDVGYGKTEVAARAVFKCVVDGKQAAVLVPTTILANQHYTTFRERFGKFPFNIEMLSRFRTDKEQRQIIKKVEDGSIDILVGTHRLLSEDIKFKDLGLLIIDEEQKFGVQHKEVIKRMKKNVDVLTLSATPIPRTLHMSLIGLRDMSTIEDPPEERFPVQTFVIEYEEEIIKEAIIREYERGGQVFFVYNRVRGIRRISAHLQELVPDVSIAVAHGQMNEKELENIMISFMNRKYDVLVCTTIIESGIDIQNTNTIIIYDADKFGLSQLYQLRGRVGRSNRMAYAYFAYQKDKVLTEQSEKRLKAIKEFTEFGSGFKIAMRDLEIRGAGNLLGVEQHGHLVTIGYELYCKLLDETVRELKGETFIRHDEVSIEIETNAYIPKQYIQDEITKVEVYKRIASIRSKDEMPEIEDELVDRFGEFPVEMYNLIKIAYIKFLAEVAGISRIREDKGRITFEFHENNVLKPYLINGLALKYGTRIHINAGERPFIKFSYRQFNSRLNELILFMEEIIELHSSERRFNQND